MYNFQRTNQVQNTSSDRFAIAEYQRNTASNDSDCCVEIAKLSQGSKWVLLTSQCRKPKSSMLKQHKVNAAHLLQMMPSRVMSEKEVVLKAMLSGNASAVIASKSISAIDQKHLLSRAAQLNCALFFTNDASELFSHKESIH